MTKQEINVSEFLEDVRDIIIAGKCVKFDNCFKFSKNKILEDYIKSKDSDINFRKDFAYFANPKKSINDLSLAFIGIASNNNLYPLLILCLIDNDQKIDGSYVVIRPNFVIKNYNELEKIKSFFASFDKSEEFDSLIKENIFVFENQFVS